MLGWEKLHKMGCLNGKIIGKYGKSTMNGGFGEKNMYIHGGHAITCPVMFATVWSPGPFCSMSPPQKKPAVLWGTGKLPEGKLRIFWDKDGHRTGQESVTWD
jgi:hypothetical protein